MNNASFDEEYEEVESPFATKAADRSNSHRDKLRSRKNVFNRPFATAPSVAPAVYENSKRRMVDQVDMDDLIENHQSTLPETPIEYLDDEELEEEEFVEKKPTVRHSTKKAAKSKKGLLPKIGWGVIGLLVLRLIFMDRGVWDYVATESNLEEKRQELKSIQVENSSLKSEITKIQTDRNYQRLLAKEHLGVIAADEFLILFAGENSEESAKTSDTQL
jgi:cell division protein FtsB